MVERKCKKRRSFQKVRVIRKDKYNFAKHSKEWVENSGIQEKNGLFMKFTTQKQLFAKLKQEANLERTKARGAVQAKKSIR